MGLSVNSPRKGNPDRYLVNCVEGSSMVRGEFAMGVKIYGLRQALTDMLL
jgi:hypothetical protein